MKARPRSVENQVADAINAHFYPLGMTPVERIPVLGRTGPDLSLNEMKLVIDVKSRLEVPKAIFFPLLGAFRMDNMTCCRLSCLNFLWADDSDDSPLPYLDYSSKLISDYLGHMHEWTKVHEPLGVSCVVLHRPKMPIGSSVAIIYSNNRRRLVEYATRCSDYAVPTE